MEGLVKWVRVTEVWASKRRFSLNFAIDEFVTALENEVDHGQAKVPPFHR
jgi:hypothetical protein